MSAPVGWTRCTSDEERRQRIFEAKRRYREKNRAVLNAKSSAAYWANVEESRKYAREFVKEWYKKNKERLKPKKREANIRWYHSKKNDPVFKEKKRGHTRKYCQKHKPKKAADSAKRRAIIRYSLTVKPASKNRILRFYEMANRVTKCTGIPHEVDHIIPLARGGHHHESNLQILPENLNRSKGAKIL